MDGSTIVKAMKDQDITLVTSLPCDKARGLFFRIPREFRHVGLTREEDGIGISAGASFAGARPMMVIQSSGLGNMFNALLSLTSTYQLPLPILASWRGTETETIAAQVPFNRPLPEILSSARIPFTIISGSDQREAIENSIASSFRHRTPHVILLKPGCDEDCPEPILPDRSLFSGNSTLEYQRKWRIPEMTRFDAIEIVARSVSDEVIVSNIGIPSRELFFIRDRPLNLYMLGSYTQASPIGLGIAVCSDREVIVLDGDGSLLGSSVLPVIAAASPGNLTVVCLDNGVFGSTGNQPRPGRDRTDLRLMAIGAGFDHTWTVHTREELGEALLSGKSGPKFIHARISPGNRDVPTIPLTPIEIRDRVMSAIGSSVPG